MNTYEHAEHMVGHAKQINTVVFFRHHCTRGSSLAQDQYTKRIQFFVLGGFVAFALRQTASSQLKWNEEAAVSPARGVMTTNILSRAYQRSFALAMGRRVLTSTYVNS